MKLYVRLFALVSLFFTQSLFADGVRIAILGDLDKERAEVDSLTSSLSKEPGVELVERSEIDKILKEQALSLSSSSDEGQALKIGSILGANGMIVVKSFEWEGKRVLGARLVATSSGAILDAWIQDVPSVEAGRFADAVRFKFVPLFKKLSLERKDVIAVSLLSVRSPVDTQEGRTLERSLTLLLSQRLMMEKSFLVLERWRLGSLAWEKELNLDSDSLWTGSCVLDGSVEALERPGEKSQVKATLRFRRPGSKEPEFISARGDSSDLKGLVESLMPPLRKLLRAPGQDSVAASWDIGKEADLYFKEAEWLIRAGSYERARESANSAKALGRAERDVDLLLAKACQEAVQYDVKKLNRFMSSDIHGECKSLGPLELLARTDARTRADAMALFDDLLVWWDSILNKLPLVEGDFIFDEDSKIRVDSALWRSIEALSCLYSGKCGLPDERLLERGKILRSFCRKAMPAFMAAYGKDRFRCEYMRASTYIACIRLFPETPEESLVLYKELLGGGKLPFEREKVRYALLTWPWKNDEWLVDWSCLAEMAKSPGSLEMNDGRSKAPKGDALWDSYIASLRSGSEGDKIDAAILTRASEKALNLNGPGKSDAEALAWNYRDEIFKRKDPLCCHLLIAAADSDSSDLEFRLASYAFSKRGYVNLKILSSMLSSSAEQLELKKNPALAKRLAGEWEAYKGRNASLVSSKKADMESVKELDAVLAKYLDEGAAKEAAPARSVPSVSVKPLAVFDFFQSIGWAPLENCCLNVNDAYWDDGRLLIYGHCRNPSGTRQSSSSFISISADASSAKCELLPSERMPDASEALCRFARSGPAWIFAGSGGGLFRGSASGSALEKIADIPFFYPERLLVHGGMAYVFYSGNISDETSPSGIVEVDLTKGSWEVLASSRRNPPESPLDERPAYSCGLFSIAESGRFLVQVHPRDNWVEKDIQTFLFDPSRRKWEMQKMDFKYGSDSLTPSTLWIGDLRGSWLPGFDMNTGELSGVQGIKGYKRPEGLEKLGSEDFKVYYGESLIFDGTNRIAFSQLNWSALQIRLLSQDGQELRKAVVEVDSELLRKTRSRYGRIFADGLNIYLLFAREQTVGAHPFLVVLSLRDVFPKLAAP